MTGAIHSCPGPSPTISARRVPETASLIVCSERMSCTATPRGGSPARLPTGCCRPGAAHCWRQIVAPGAARQAARRGVTPAARDDWPHHGARNPTKQADSCGTAGHQWCSQDWWLRRPASGVYPSGTSSSRVILTSPATGIGIRAVCQWERTIPGGVGVVSG